jgi:hypothetical protein
MLLLPPLLMLMPLMLLLILLLPLGLLLLVLLLELLCHGERSGEVTVCSRTHKMTGIEGGAEIIRQSSVANGGGKGRIGRSKVGRARNRKENDD